MTLHLQTDWTIPETTAAAIDLSRLSDWLDNRPRAPTRISHFAKLAPPA